MIAVPSPAHGKTPRRRTEDTTFLGDALTFASATAWEDWLELHHADRPEAWLRIAKKRSTLETVDIGDALDVALCFGWIDGQRRALDERSYLQRYSPRRPRSDWSQVNVGKVERLIEAGRLRPPGMAAVEAARADGRWDGAYPAQRGVTVPVDLARALEADPLGRRAFEALGKTERYTAILHLEKARTAETRRRRLETLLARLSGPQDPTG